MGLISIDDREWFQQLIVDHHQQQEQDKSEKKHFISYDAAECSVQEIKEMMSEGPVSNAALLYLSKFKKIMKECKRVGSDRIRKFSFSVQMLTSS